MSIYKKTKHRQIYESHHGPIPKDDDGRTFEIHHIDGNPLNNSIQNLIALSIQDHYNIHYKQEDWIACFRIAKRMTISPKEKSDLARKANAIRTMNGTHNFQNIEWSSARATKANKSRVASGTHNLLKANRSHYNLRKPNTKIYTFEHNKTGEKVNMTQYDFIRTYSLNPGNVSSMIKDPTRSVKGWKVSNFGL
jgi:hypothetical protein